MTEAFLTKNLWSRPGLDIDTVKAIVIHWLFNPGQSARGARQWFEDRKGGDNGYGSAHIIIDDSDALLCVPLGEVAYHVGTLDPTDYGFSIGVDPNFYTLGIELAHPDWTGQPSDTVWHRAVRICHTLIDRYELPVSAIVTHWDIVGMLEKWHGKPCHRWFVEQPGEMARFRDAVRRY